jgi:hypothetical protein
MIIIMVAATQADSESESEPPFANFEHRNPSTPSQWQAGPDRSTPRSPPGPAAAAAAGAVAPMGAARRARARWAWPRTGARRRQPVTGTVGAAAAVSCACVRARARVCVRVCRARVSACVCACGVRACVRRRGGTPSQLQVEGDSDAALAGSTPRCTGDRGQRGQRQT